MIKDEGIMIKVNVNVPVKVKVKVPVIVKVKKNKCIRAEERVAMESRSKCSS